VEARPNLFASAPLFVPDQQQQLWTCWQTSSGGGWVGPNWNGATQLWSVAACRRGGGLGAQVPRRAK
jgi:hypothetical protein